jgi:hypothetical protein
LAVGTTSDFDVTRQELLDLSLGMCGVSEPQAEDYVLGVKVLNILTRHLDARAQWLHGISNTESTLTLVAGQQAYVTGILSTTISTNIYDLATAAVLIGTDRRPLVILDKPQSLRTDLLSESNGEPRAVHLEKAKLRANNRLLFYPTPNQAFSVVYTFRRPLFDFDSATDNPDMPGDFLLPVAKFLALELAPHYGNPLSDRQLMMAEAKEAWDVSVAANSSKPSYVPLQVEYF